jgi:hypothetical protein
LAPTLLGLASVVRAERLAFARPIRSMDVAIEVSPLLVLKQPDPKPPEAKGHGPRSIRGLSPLVAAMLTRSHLLSSPPGPQDGPSIGNRIIRQIRIARNARCREEAEEFIASDPWAMLFAAVR